MRDVINFREDYEKFVLSDYSLPPTEWPPVLLTKPSV